MRKLLWLLPTILLALTAPAQTNILYDNVSSFGQVGRTNLTITLTLVQPRNRYNVVTAQFISNDPIRTMTDTNGNFAFTNVCFGLYRFSLSDSTFSAWPVQVWPDTSGSNHLGSLVNWAVLNPPNNWSNYFNIPQIYALLAGINTGGTGFPITSNGVTYSIDSTGGLLTTNATTTAHSLVGANQHVLRVDQFGNRWQWESNTFNVGINTNMTLFELTNGQARVNGNAVLTNAAAFDTNGAAAAAQSYILSVAPTNNSSGTFTQYGFWQFLAPAFELGNSLSGFLWQSPVITPLGAAYFSGNALGITNVQGSNIVGPVAIALLASNAPDGNISASLNNVTNIVKVMTNALSNGAFTANPLTNGSNLNAANLTNTIPPAVLTASGVVTTDATLENYISAVGNLQQREKDHLRGAFADLTANGFRNNLVDAWPLYSSQGGIYGTNQYSVYQQPWTGFNQAISGFYNTLRGGPYTTYTNILTLRQPLSGPWTIGVTVRTPQEFNGGTVNGLTEQYALPFFELRTPDGTNWVSILTRAPTYDSLLIATNGQVFNYNDSSTASNTIRYPSNAGPYQAQQFSVFQKQLVLSFDGTNKFQLWYKGEPCSFTVSNNANWSALTYQAPASLAGISFSQIALGVTPEFARWGAGAGGFAGAIDNLVVFNTNCAPNVVAGSGAVTVSPLATVATRFMRAMEPCPYEYSWDGASMLQLGYVLNNNMTNEIWEAWAFRNPSIPCIGVFSRAGSDTTQMTNQGYTATKAQFTLTDQARWIFTFNRFNCLPSWVTGLEVTDVARAESQTGTNAFFQNFANLFGPIRNNPQNKLIWLGESIPGDVTAGWCGYVDDAMKTNQYITQYVGNQKWVCPKGIVDDLNTNLCSAGTHFDGADEGLAWYIVQEEANTIDGLPFVPPPSGMFASITNQFPIYPVTLGSSPAYWTNCVPTNGTTPCIFYYGAGTTISDVTKGTDNGTSVRSIPVGLSGGTVTLQPHEYIKITAVTEPTAAYQPIQ
jgi:hypothetical protein